MSLPSAALKIVQIFLAVSKLILFSDTSIFILFIKKLNVRVNFLNSFTLISSTTVSPYLEGFPLNTCSECIQFWGDIFPEFSAAFKISRMTTRRRIFGDLLIRLRFPFQVFSLIILLSGWLLDVRETLAGNTEYRMSSKCCSSVDMVSSSSGSLLDDV